MTAALDTRSDGGPCPDRDVLQQFLTGRLSDAEAAPVEQHLTECSTCLALLGEMSARVEVELRGCLASGAAEAPDTVTTLIQRVCFLGAAPATRNPPDTPWPADQPTVPRGEPAAAPGQLGRYRVRRLLGAGGMGAVYLADDPELGRPVAVKVPQFGGSPEAQAEARQRFVREARAAAAVRHARVCPIYDVGEQAGTPYVVMAFIEGCSLAQRIKREGRFADAAQAVDLALQLAEGLAAVHQCGLIHRDLKPANVLLDAAGDAFLSDFGLARRHDDADRLTLSGALVGTLAYMAPEQADTAAFGPLTPRTDVYSLGVVMYEMLSGSLPFVADSSANLLYQTVHGTPRPLRQLRPDLDRGLEAIVLKAMARQPRERFADARELAAALASHWQVLKERAAKALAVTPVLIVGVQRQDRRQRWARVAAFGAVAAAGLLLCGVWYWNNGGNSKNGQQTQPPPPPPPPDLPAAAIAHLGKLSNEDAAVRVTAVKNLADHKHPAVVEALGKTLTDKDPRVLRAAAKSLQKLGDKAAVPFLIKRLSDDVWGKTSRTKQLLIPGSGKEPPPFENWPSGPNQGTRYAALDALRQLAPDRVIEALQAAKRSSNVDVQKWATRELHKAAAQEQPPPRSPHPGKPAIKEHDKMVRAVAFSPDGKLLATGGDDKSIRIFEVATGKRIDRIRHDAEIDCLAFAPDGATLAAAGADRAVTIWDAAAWEMQRTIAGGSASKIIWFAFAPDGQKLVTVGFQNSTPVLWDVGSGQPLATLNGHTDHVNAAVFSPDSTMVATVSDDRTVRLWDLTGKSKPPLKAHDRPVTCAAFSPDGNKLATGGKDHTIVIWDLTAGKAVRPDLQLDGPVDFVGWTRDGRIVSKTQRQMVQLWSLSGQPPVTVRDKFTETVAGVFKESWADTALTSDARTLAFRPYQPQRYNEVLLVDLSKFIDTPK